MGLFEEYMERKKNGGVLNINDLAPEILETMFIQENKTDRMIANLFDAKPNAVTKLRRKNGITIRNSIINDFLDNPPEEIENKIKDELFSESIITKIAKAVTHFTFRNGPIEDMHADIHKNITDQDMKKLNKFMVNRLAYIFILMKENRWFEFKFLVDNLDKLFGHDWDEAQPDDGGMSNLLKETLNNYKN